MGHLKMDCENIFNTKKERHMPYTILVLYLEFAIFPIVTYYHWFT